MFLQHYLVNGTIFGKKNVNGYKTFERNLILRKTEHDVTTNVRYSCHILMKLEFFWQVFFSQNTQISNFMKIRPVGAEVFTCGRTVKTDMTKLIVALAYLRRRLKMSYHS